MATGEASNAATGAGGTAAGLRTVVHVTHEAVEHMGGIGTVLEGLMTSPAYRRVVGRSILVAPLFFADRKVARPVERLGEFGLECLYSGPEHHDPEGYGAIFRPVEWAFGVKVVYGTRRFREHGAGGEGATARAEVLLVDVTNPDPQRLGAFKWMLYDRFGIDSRRYEHGWDYEEYCRLAEPAYHALCALLPRPGVERAAGAGGGVAAGGALPAVVFSHEYMGMCTALRCLTDRARFRCVFHAHECSTARRIVEHLPGHDVAFYPAMRAAEKQGRFIEDVFGDQSDFSRHALVRSTHLLDAVLAVGHETAEELRFLSPQMAKANVKVAYNGLPAPVVTAAEKERSRGLVWRWLEKAAGVRPDYLVTHVTRPVVSKGLWRDQKVMAHLERLLRARGETAAYVLLTCGAPARSAAEVEEMAARYGWPLNHEEGPPDLCGPEVSIYRAMQMFTAHAQRGRMLAMAGVPSGGAHAHGEGAGEPEGQGAGQHVAVVPILVNQFGFSRERLGPAAPAEVTIDDLRRAADVELGMSVYEPFGIAHLEALHAGAVCVPSTVCGCLGLVRRAMGELGMDERACPVVLSADFTGAEVTDPVRYSSHERDALEERVCAQVAEELSRRLPRNATERAELLAVGQRLAGRMSWDAVWERDIWPVLRGL